MSQWSLQRAPASALLGTAMAVVSTALVCTRGIRADDTASESEKQLVGKWYAEYQKIHESMELNVVSESGKEVLLTPQEVMTLHNPLRKGVRHGRVDVWTDDEQRPVVVGSLWSEIDVHDSDVRNITYEFHSLSQRPVMVEQDGDRVWHCQQPGIRWQKHRGAEIPAASRTARLIQMRQIARSYLVRSEPVNHSRTPPGVYHLLPQPLYRYPEQTPAVTDGALFTYSDFSDPRVFLLLEVRDDQWQVAFARSTVLPLKVTYQKKTVWEVPRTRGNGWQNVRNDSDPFFIHYARERRPTNAPGQILTGRPP